MRIVVDTNVLISGLINAQNPPGKIVDFVRNGKARMVVDDRILEEYTDVLMRSRMRKWIPHEDALDIMLFLQVHSVCVSADVIVRGLPDKGDIPFAEVAKTAKVPLITGNLKHYPPHLCRGISIMTPTAFFEKCVASEEAPGKKRTTRRA